MNNEHPLVSIVIPAYNYADYLDEAIESILDQDYPNIELIVLDDGSTDDTREVLKKYTGLFHWETHGNMGQAKTINKGWRMSRGSVLTYLSPDDALAPTAVSTSVEHLLANPDVVLTYCDYNLIDAGSKVVRRVYAPDFHYRDMVIKLICPPGPGAFLRREAFTATGGWNSLFRQVPDYEYWLRLGLRGRFLRIPKVLASFRVHSKSQSFTVVSEQNSEEYVRVVRGYYSSQAAPSEILAAKDEALSNAYIFTARSHMRSGRYKKGLRNLWRGVCLYPKNVRVRTFRAIFHGLFNHLRYRNV